MSLLRGTWNNGQAVTVPELNRPLDVSANADDRVYESLLTPGSVQKKIIPLSEESTSVNPRLLVLPGTTNGALKVQPCTMVAGHPSVATDIKMSALLPTALDSALVGSNSSGSTRIDLLYATVSRSTPATIGSPGTGVAYVGVGVADPSTGAQQSRTVKDTTSGTVTTQTISVYDVPTITLTILAGTPGGGAPSLPADGASAYNFSLAQITVLNGYTSGSAITQSSIAPTWNGGWIQPHRVHSLKPLSGFYAGAANERPGSTLSERWGSQLSFFVHFKLVTATTIGTVNTIIDNSIDWRRRIIWGYYFYLGSGSIYPLEGNTTLNPTLPWSNTAGANWGPIPAMVEFNNSIAINQSIQYGSNVNNLLFLSVTNVGDLRIGRGSTLIDGTNGDAIALVLHATDQFVNGI